MSWTTRLASLRNVIGSRSRRPSGTSRNKPVLRSPLSLEALEDRLVLSPTLINPTTWYPASAVVEVYSTFSNGAVFQGTGTMVNANTVLTAGHMTYNASAGGWAKTVEVIPARNGNLQPYGVAFAKSEATFNQFIADDKVNSNGHAPGDGDIGFLALNSNIGNKTGTVGFMADGNLVNVNKFGYPGTNGYNGTGMYQDFGPLNQHGNGTSGFAYWGWSTSSMSSIPGESGSSLILKIGSQMGIIGVQDVGNSSEGYAEVTTQNVINNLISFENSHPAIATTVSAAQSATPPTVLNHTSYGMADASTQSPSQPAADRILAVSSDATSATPATSPPSASSLPSAIAPQSPSAMQLFLDGITLAMDLSRSDGLATALADSALMHDLDAAAGGALNPYLDAGVFAALSTLHSDHNN